MLGRACLCLMPHALRDGARCVVDWAGRRCINQSWFLDRGALNSDPTEVAGPFSLRNRLSHDFSLAGLPELLRYEDRNSMAFSIESRVPFLTPKLVQFVFSLPESYLISREGVSKYVFREAMRGIAPDVILDRRDKIGFVTPERAWLGATRPWCERSKRPGRPIAPHQSPGHRQGS